MSSQCGGGWCRGDRRETSQQTCAPPRFAQTVRGTMNFDSVNVSAIAGQRSRRRFFWTMQTT
jgi:hypothetical protein